MKEIYITKPYLPPIDEYIEKISRIWQNHVLTNMGPLHREFEQYLTQFLQVPFCLASANGHLALEMAIQSLDLKGEVITTPFTFASTTHAIVRNGLTPVFCDIQENNYTINADKIEELITEKTSAILPVHVYGQICDTEKIQKIADQHHLKVIYDAAHAFGEEKCGRGVGTFGDLSIFSFHATKPFNSIEGGAVTFSNYELGARLYQLKNFGFMGEDNVCGIGGNAKLSEFHSAMGLCNLEHLDEIHDGRKRVADHYRERLSTVAGLRILERQQGVKENYAYFPVLIDEKQFGEDRDGVYCRLKEKGIYARRYFYPLTKDFACYRKQFSGCKTPVAEYVTEHILTLPLYDSLSDEEIDYICDTILKRG
mgnify:CR=1 FL=1